MSPLKLSSAGRTAAALALGAAVIAPASAGNALAHGTAPSLSIAHSFAGHTRIFRNSRRPSVTLTQLYSFSSTDGANPSGAQDLFLSTSGGQLTTTLFGDTFSGGASQAGTIYSEAIKTDGFTSLYPFSGTPDGSGPSGLAFGFLDYSIGGAPLQYGVASGGGALGYGSVFSVSSTGLVNVIHSFTGGADGATPLGRIAKSLKGNFYGTTSAGGAYGYGTIFEITPAGAFSTVYTFKGKGDGGTPLAGLAPRFDAGGKANIVLHSLKAAAIAARPFNYGDYISQYLYGTTSTAGSGGGGTVFRFNPGANSVKTIYNFGNGADGSAPAAELTSDFADNLYGTASNGGSAGAGTVFEITSAGYFKVLHDFGFDQFGNLSSGATPLAAITFGFDGNLYGTASAGGANDLGNVFEISNAGFADLYDFSGPDGASPQGKLIDGFDGNLYGTTSNGGTLGYGTIFNIPHP
jgi:uncharacterized repeat protein (TIGR03803 family)